MITRINLIEKKRLQVTYATLFLAAAGVALFCLLLYSVLLIDLAKTKNKVVRFQSDIGRLKSEREQIINRRMGPLGEASLTAIQTALENGPAWASVLNAITEALPPRVWLASVKSTSKDIVINGEAKNPRDLTGFLTNLGKNRRFAKVVLTTSSEEAGGLFQFTISCDIGAPQWNLKP